MDVFKIHPAADIFPMMGEAELSALASDIVTNGQAQPALMWNGVIIDGRNRLAACRAVGVTPKIKEVEFSSEELCVRYIVSQNIHRRHLNESQRAAIAAELANLGEGRAPLTASIEAVSQSEAAELLNVSRASVQRAKAVRSASPELADKVKRGEMSVHKATQLVRERHRAETDPSQAADSIIDATAERHAEGDTPRARSFLAAAAKLDDTERTYCREGLRRMFQL